MKTTHNYTQYNVVHEQKGKITLVSCLTKRTVVWQKGQTIFLPISKWNHSSAESQGLYLKCTAVLSWRAEFQVTWNLFESQVPYLNSDTSKASLFYCKTPDLLGESLIFSLKLYRHLSGLHMMNSKVTWRYWYKSLFLSSNHVKSWRVKLHLKG